MPVWPREIESDAQARLASRNHGTPLLPRSLFLPRNTLKKGDRGLADLLEEAEHVVLEPHQALRRELREKTTADVWY